MDGKYRSDLQQRERYQSYHDVLMYGASFDCAHATNSYQRHTCSGCLIVVQTIGLFTPRESKKRAPRPSDLVSWFMGDMPKLYHQQESIMESV